RPWSRLLRSVPAPSPPTPTLFPYTTLFRSIANVLDSAIPRLADGALYTHAGPEIGVASTKCFTAQLAALLLLSVYLGRRRETLSRERAQEVLQALWETPSHMRDVLGDADYMHVIAKKLTHA